MRRHIIEEQLGGKIVGRPFKSAGFLRKRGARRRRARRAVPGFIKTGELKYFDTVLAETTVANSGTILNSSLNLLVQGSGETQRVGRKVVLKSIHLRGFCEANDSATVGAEAVRIIIYLDKQANGAAATVGDILESADYRAFNDLEAFGRYIILKDWYFALNRMVNATITADKLFSVGMVLSWNRRVNIPLYFEGSTGALTEVKSNNIGVMAITRSNLVVGVEYHTRIRYSDM